MRGVINERYTVSHTPGPWKTESYRQSPESPFIAVTAEEMTFGYNRDRKERGVVCIVQVGPGRHLDQAESDARLIAAAPDLLAACQFVMTKIKECMAEMEAAGQKPQIKDYEEVAVIQTAIDKATLAR